MASPSALASGFVATLAMTTVSYVMLPLLGWSQVDVSFWTARTITADQLAFAVLAMMMHLLVGLTYACLFARLPRYLRHLRFPWRKGLSISSRFGTARDG